MLPQKQPVLILASSSPRRQDLLRQAGIQFKADAPHINEDQKPGEAPLAYALRLSREKAQAVAPRYAQSFILGADTIVVLDDEILGKPRDHADALRMLRLLSGRTHQVTTAVTLLAPPREETRYCRTHVTFRKLAEEEIQQYVASGEPMDKAGAYAIQGGAAGWASRIDGEHSNVVGLPLSVVAEMLRANGLLH